MPDRQRFLDRLMLLCEKFVMRGADGQLGAIDPELIQFEIAGCALGLVLVAVSADGVCCVLLGDDVQMLKHDFLKRFPRGGCESDGLECLQMILEVIENPGLPLACPLDARGTAFQKRVWRALQEIPPGQRMSYSQVAERIGQPRASRAVASACTANPLAVLIPCHRVVRRDGGVSGYRWGIARKCALLERESSLC